MLQSFYDVIEDQKHYYSKSYLQDVCFGSRVSPIISVADPSFSVLGVGSQVPCKIKVPNFRSQVPLLGSRVSASRSHLWLGSRVSCLGSHLLRLGSRSEVLPKVLGLGSHFSDMSLLTYDKSCLVLLLQVLFKNRKLQYENIERKNKKKLISQNFVILFFVFD